MSIEYAYEIVSVNEAARCMEVVYTSEGHQTMHISARLPFEGEQLEAVIKMFAPVALWIELAAPVTVPQVGTRGTVAPVMYIEEESAVEGVPERDIPVTVAN